MALGSNLGDRRAHLASARSRLTRLGGVVVVRRSSIFETEPVGPGDQDPYLNAVDLLDVELGPEALLDAILSIERDLGRVRDVRWGPRTIDLDLLFHGDALRRDVRLELPHPGIPYRSFVLVPLAEVAPDWVHPATGRTPAEMRAALRARGGWTEVERLEAPLPR